MRLPTTTSILFAFFATNACASPATTASVYLLPSQGDFSTTQHRELSASSALSVVAHWLSLDRLDAKPAHGLVEQSNGLDISSVFGSDKSTKSLVIALDNAHRPAEDLVPAWIRSTYAVNDGAFRSKDVLNALVTRARTILGAASIRSAATSTTSSLADRTLDLFTLSLSESATAQSFTHELSSLASFLDAESGEPTFGAFKFDISALEELPRDAYDQAVAALHAALDSAAAQNVKTALLYVPNGHLGTRATQPPQQPLPPSLPPSHPIFSTDRCFTSQDKCTNATNSCGSKGTCQSTKRAGRECFSCACRPTTDSKGRKTVWVGERCERIDVSGPFTLLAGTAIFLTLLIGGSIAVLASVGGDKLPSVLSSVSVPGMKDS